MLTALRKTNNSTSQKHLIRLIGSAGEKREGIKIKKSALKLILTVTLMTLILSGTSAMLNPTATFVKAATPAVEVANYSSGTVATTELINYYGMTSNEIQQIISILHNQGISMITLRLNAFSEYTSGNSNGISAAKRIIAQAKQFGMVVNIDLHTWHTIVTDIFASTTKQNQYLNYVKNIISQFSDNDVFAWMVMNEPPAKTATSSDNAFILQVISTAHELTSRPVSVRFMGGYSPDTGHYSKSIDDAADFLCRNVYWNPQTPSTTVYGVTNAKMENMISNANQRGKALWITEFGKTKTNLDAQTAYIKAFVSYAKTKGIEAIFAWVTQNENPSGESYNLFNGYTPNPAFYQLVSTGAPTTTTPSTPDPTPTSSPTPDPTPTPSSDSTRTRTYSYSYSRNHHHRYR